MSALDFLKVLKDGIPVNPLPENTVGKNRNPKVPHAPKRNLPLSKEERDLAVKNALRYFPTHLHCILSEEFKQELEDWGHIYMYRFLPNFPMKAYSIDEYPAKTQDARAIMLMIFNNLDPNVAQFPEELVVYGGKI